ncbi:alpha/beta hydrolase [Microtetraspora sp. AC03309]|uniref:alpha/beta hydrolase n=1 Tax=Microtetraspora sp. AC03309 TaxID=2779376 RepID=UPI001E327FFD|nr:alpha/beta hydrolase [Microtetraspora sp. AC03309]
MIDVNEPARPEHPGHITGRSGPDNATPEARQTSGTEQPCTVAPHPRGSRLRRTLLAALVTVSVAVPVSGAARSSAVPAPVPAASAASVPLRAATPAVLAARYAASGGAIRAAERTASGGGHRWRAAMLRAMADPARRFLFFDGRDGGRAAEVFGDLTGAERIAVLVPGSDTDLDKYGYLRGGSLRLLHKLGGGSAVIAWLGYRTPGTVSLAALTSGRAEEAAPDLRTFIRELSAAQPAARISLLCHSYGSVVCARAASGLDVADIVLYGSAGVGVDDVAALRTRATVWAGRGTADWIRDVPHAWLRLPFVTVGFGADPVSPEFGARVFAAGVGGHSDYLKGGSVALENIARIVSGQAPSEAGRGA